MYPSAGASPLPVVPEPIPNLPFAYRLPADVAARIHGTATDTPLVEMGSPRRQLVVLVLVLGLLGCGLMTGLPSGGAQALRGEACHPSGVLAFAGDAPRDEVPLC